MKVLTRWNTLGRTVTTTTLVAFSLIGSKISAALVNCSTNTYGSGRLYQTTVERQSRRELSAADLRQASVLTSDLLTHVNQAVYLLEADCGDTAKAEIGKARALLRIVRTLLPAEVLKTTVKDAEGREVYQDEQRIQDSRIPVYADDIAMSVAAEAAVQTNRNEISPGSGGLAECDVVKTAVVVDLDLVEQKLNSATANMLLLRQAASELARIQADAVRFVTHTNCSPLLDAQHALQLAERLVREHRCDAAGASLQTARTQLEAYRSLADNAASQELAKCDTELQRLSAELQTVGAADKIRALWCQVAGWPRQVPGQLAQPIAQQAGSGT